MKTYSRDKDEIIRFNDVHNSESSTNGIISNKDKQGVIDSGVDIAPYIEPVKTLDQLQSEAVEAMASAVIDECRSGTGKLYFSNIESAAMYTSVIQEDAEIRARAEELMLWSFAIDTYGQNHTIRLFSVFLPN